MAKIKPLTLYFTSVDELEKMKAEYAFIGREVFVDYKKLELIVLTVPRTYKKKPNREVQYRSRYED